MGLTGCLTAFQRRIWVTFVGSKKQLLQPLTSKDFAGVPGFCTRGLFGSCLRRGRASFGVPSPNPCLHSRPRSFLGLPLGLFFEGRHRGFAKAAKPKSIRDVKAADEAAPIFQYVGGRAKRKDRVFVCGFTYTGALGIPSFILPDAGKKRRRIQPTPYRLEVEEKVREEGKLPAFLELGLFKNEEPNEGAAPTSVATETTAKISSGKGWDE